jgi:DNA invertase Pin-like site-specific DNA recombinase
MQAPKAERAASVLTFARAFCGHDQGLRVSGKGQVDCDGFTRQLKAIRDYAAAHDIKVVNIYREEGVSGSKESADRLAWSELMTALHANGVRVVIIERLDRLARDLMVQETIIADLRKYGFELVSVAEPDLMANDPTRILVRQMMGAVAQYEKSQIVLKLRGDAEAGEGGPL